MGLRFVLLFSFCCFAANAELHHLKLTRHNHKEHKLPHTLGHGNIRNRLRQKYGLDSVAKVNAVTSHTTSTGSVESQSLFNYLNLQFSMDLSIGTQLFTMAPDTGSSDLWAPGKECTFCINTCKNTAFNPSDSKTFVSSKQTFNITYGSGSVSGTVDFDTVKIGHLTILNQTFGVVDNSTMCSTFDGIMGMAFPNLSAMGAVPPFQNLIAQKQVKDSVFSFYLKSDSPAGSLMILGGSNSSLYSGELTYTPVTKPRYWMFKMNLIGFYQWDYRNCLGSCDAIMDTGTSLIVGPPKAIDFLNKQIGATYNSNYDLWTVNCAKISTLPNLKLHIAYEEFYVTPQTYITNISNVCISPFTSLAGLQFWIIGDVFMRENYVEFNPVKLTLAIARSK
ncbi:LOW QUALITY PROTEIN: pepsin A-4-like [Drosophila tropicalis]|uniref:LOW QUALITY PROTEIN: pepsin A-4-like n=1 Tax=Drosophila tropicalis TaxID=46794 RepID=UPI0035ABE73D